MVLAVNCPRAGAAGRQADALHAVQRVLRHGAGEHAADRLVGVEHADLAAVEQAGQGASAKDEGPGDIAADEAHHHAGQGLVAPGEADQCVVAMCADHRLDAVGDQFAADQAEPHAAMGHAHAVGHGDGGEFERRAARHRDTGLGVGGLGG